MHAEDNQPTAMLATLQRLMDELGEQEWSYGWMPARQVAAVVALLQASALRSVGKTAAALAHLERAGALLDAALREHQFDLEVGSCGLAARLAVAGPWCGPWHLRIVYPGKRGPVPAVSALRLVSQLAPAVLLPEVSHPPAPNLCCPPLGRALRARSARTPCGRAAAGRCSSC